MKITEKTISEVFDLYEKFGNEEYGESVTQLEHMVQSAELAAKEGYDEEVILAAFFHDIGHFLETPGSGKDMDGFGAMHHEDLGADYLKKNGFSEKLAALVGSHVAAKRYLTFKYPDYYHDLSEASKTTLKFQGGPMNEAEAEIFENDKLFPLYIKMREWDDKAKIVGYKVESIQPYKDMCYKLVIE
jgi:phosphonate degradation associated HDIG domain protein